VRDLAFGDGVTLEDVVVKAADAAREALRRTPEQLDSLRRAGVVDAGGRGVVVVLDALVQVVTGRHRVAAPDEPGAVASRPTLLTEDDSEGGPEFEVMYLLDAEESAVSQMRAELEPLGDSLLVIGGGDLWNVHVHVDDVGAAIEAGIRAGRPHRVRVTHFGSQVARQRVGRTVGGRAVIAAAAGEGLALLFEAAGAHVVRSRPGRRASTGDLLAAVQAAHADEVVLLPESKDTRTVADAAAEKARGDGIRVAVLPTVASVQVLSALAVHDPSSRFEDDVVAMTGAARATRHGAVTRASKEALTSAGICRPGDVLGILEGDIKLIGDDVSEMACEVVDRLLGTGGELVTLLIGADADPSIAEAVTAHLAEHHHAVEVTVYDGGQQLYPVLIGVE
jgi:DAK2 domain fusion protein YloV